MRTLSIMLASLALAACSQADDPENVPLLGMWQTTEKLQSIRTNGRVLPLSRIPADMRQLESEAVCREPMFNSEKDTQRDLNKSVEGSCSIYVHETDGSYIKFAGRCSSMDGFEFEGQPSFETEGAYGSDRYRLENKVFGTMAIDGGPMTNLTIETVSIGKRIGDC